MSLFLLRTMGKRPRLTLATLAFAAALIGLAGCSGGSAKGGKVSGKVLLGGQPVAGTVYFTGGGEGKDKKEYTSPIGADGQYQISNIPKGDYKISVKGMPGANVPGANEAKGPEGKDLPALPGADKTKPPGVPPPEKYANPETSGLTISVTGATQPYDITLQP